MKYLNWALIIFGLALPWSQAAVQMSLDSSSFMRESNQRSTNASSLRASYQNTWESERVQGKADLLVDAFTHEPSSATPEIKELYISTTEHVSSLHRMSLGRKKLNWSEMDEDWRMGFWSPRYTWDPLNPETVGLTGSFYEYKTRYVQAQVYATPISIPERGYPIQSADGQLISAQPLHIPAPKRLLIEGQSIDIQYNLSTPPLADLVVNPGAGAKFRYGEDTGGWASLAYAYKPIAPADIATEGILIPSEKVFDATIHPRVLYHHLAVVEMGYRTSETKLWVGITGDRPFQTTVPNSWIIEPIGPSFTAGGGLGFRLFPRTGMTMSYLSVFEDRPKPREDDIELNLPSRFQYREATKVELEHRLSARSVLSSRWVADLENRSHLVGADWGFQWWSSRWSAKFGVDLIFTKVGVPKEGYVGQYSGDDRVRGSLSYVF